MEASAAEAQSNQVGKFGVVGIINTLIDFTLFNAASKFLGFTLIQANVLSTTVAMIFSYVANRKVVFKPSDRTMAHEAAVFLLVTAFGLYVLQNATIHFLTVVWRAPLVDIVRLVRDTGIHAFNDTFYINNGAKAVGTVVSLAWNYVMYKKVVFR